MASQNFYCLKDVAFCSQSADQSSEKFLLIVLVQKDSQSIKSRKHVTSYLKDQRMEQTIYSVIRGQCAAITQPVFLLSGGSACY